MCFSCNLETAILDEEFLKSSESGTTTSDNTSEPDQNGHQEAPEQVTKPEYDVCAHDVPIDEYHWCAECENHSPSDHPSETANTEFESHELDHLESLLRRKTSHKEERQACGHNSRNPKRCWKCERDDIKKKTRPLFPEPEIRSITSSNAVIEDWLKKTLDPIMSSYQVNSPDSGFEQISFSSKDRASVNLLQIQQEQNKTKNAKPRITFKRIRNDLAITLPEKKHDADAGYDLQSMETAKIPPGGIMLMKTGLSVSIPRGYFGLIKARSSLAITGISVEGGVIDSGYEGEIITILVNRNLDRSIIIQAYDRIAQLIPIAILTEPSSKDKTRKSPRKNQGFGSTSINAVHPKKITEYQDGKSVESKFTYVLGAKLTNQQCTKINRTMKKYESILATSFEDIKGSNLRHKHSINTGNQNPIKINPYPMTAHKKEWVDKEVEEMLKTGIISRSKSPWSFPIVVVAKKTVDGKTAPRMCINFQKLNQVTIKDAHPIPRVIEILEQMQGNPDWFTSLDLFSGFNQIGLTEDAKQKCAFSTSRGHYHFNRMPFGLCNAPATFQRVMNEIFHDLIGKTMHVYIDDVTIYTKTFAEHMVVLNEVLRRIKMHGMFLKPKKCTIAAHELHMLGHIISKNGIKTDPAKVTAVSKYPDPTSKTEVRAFMGLAGYYRHFIQNCSKIAEPINRTLKKDLPFKWTDEAKIAFKLLKEKLCSAPIL